MKLKIIIEKDETGYYFAEAPALPGCLSQGKTIAEAKENIKEAIAGWFDVMNDKMESQHKNVHEVYEELV
ncbi:type II toxin-antitoxin system HicB family antitoxin [candidate division KSB1 bacterium]|nr:type II toxin-antitoxin system HicB family antitoxin [candidate division KSB1 bacterium]MBL7092454.1 type II toxin-antitoxin system HicB family antitoxin [candidate division KSB1 bacterium]